MATTILVIFLIVYLGMILGGLPFLRLDRTGVALLGAIADGDIGSHFPPSDERWRGAASHLFLEHARDLVLARGGVIDHVDVTIICEAPKIGLHRDAMRDAIAAMLRLRKGRVGVKATTTERLGFTGRGEGMAAQAVATIRMEDDA